MIHAIRCFLRRADEGACDEVVETRHGTAMLTPSLPLVWQMNAIHVEDHEADAETLAAEADHVQAGFAHRKLVVHDERRGAFLGPRFAELGWTVFRSLVMVRARAADGGPQPGAAAAEVSRAVGAAALAAFRRQQPFGREPEAVRQLAEMDERYGRLMTARDFASPPRDPACTCRLYMHDGLAQVDEVGTLEARRRRGHARAAVTAAADSALGAGCPAVFLLTDASDWPQELYGRLGFDEVGSVHEFLKLPISTPRP